MKLKKGDVVVRTRKTRDEEEHRLGRMYEIYEDSKDESASYSAIYSMSVSSYRKATETEITAFNNGITNINDITSENKIYSIEELKKLNNHFIQVKTEQIYKDIKKLFNLGELCWENDIKQCFKTTANATWNLSSLNTTHTLIQPEQIKEYNDMKKTYINPKLVKGKYYYVITGDMRDNIIQAGGINWDLPNAHNYLRVITKKCPDGNGFNHNEIKTYRLATKEEIETADYVKTFTEYKSDTLPEITNLQEKESNLIFEWSAQPFDTIMKKGVAHLFPIIKDEKYILEKVSKKKPNILLY